MHDEFHLQPCLCQYRFFPSSALADREKFAGFPRACRPTLVPINRHTHAERFRRALPEARQIWGCNFTINRKTEGNLLALAPKHFSS